MLSIIGYVIVFGAVIGGFVMEGGAIGILIQPVEFLIIGGAGIGALVVGTPIKILMAMLKT